MKKNPAMSRTSSQSKAASEQKKAIALSNPVYLDDTSFFTNLLNALEDYAVFTIDKDGFVTTWNVGAKRLLGYEEKEILGRNADLFFTEEDLKKGAHKAELKTAYENSKALDEKWHVRKDGSRFWVSGYVFALRDSQGKHQGYVKVMRDLTERRWGMKLVQQSEERYRAFITNSTEGIWRFELEKPLRITLPVKKQIDHCYEFAYLAECNDAMAQMYGFSKAEEITGARMSQFLPRNNAQNIAYLTSFITSHYRLAEIESQEVDRNGNEMVFLNNLVGNIENGYLIRAWGTQRDITEQKKTAAALKELADIVEYSDDAIIRRKLDGTVLSWNKGAEIMYGFSANEIIGKDIKATIPNDLIHEADEISQKIINGEHINHFETTRKRKDGSLIDISLSVSAIRDATGNITSISTIARDNTERKRLQQQKDEFIGIASHELKTPVTSIKAYAQLIQKRFAKKGDESAVLLLSKLEAQLNRLTDLIGDLLDVTKIESGKMQFTFGYYDFNELVNEIIEEMQRTTESHTIHFSTGPTKTVYGDRHRIGQVIINLLSNAIKYSPNAIDIKVSTSLEGEAIKLCVEDFGVGIPKNKTEHVFERFYRVSGPDNTSFPGMGLGLYISSEIIKRLGGRIWVESSEGKGSTFCFLLPYKKRTIT